MDFLLISEDQKLGLLLCAVFIIAILVFWPLMTTVVWSATLAIALLPLHKRLSRIVKPSISATFITLWVLLGIMLAMSVAMSILYGNIDLIGTMAASLVNGFKNTGFSAFLPSFTEAQLSHMPQTLVQLLLQSLLSLTSNIMQALLSIVIFFLSLSMLLYYGEQVWNRLTRTLSPKLFCAVEKMSVISADTIYALIIVQISAAVISFLLAIPFFFFLGYGSVLLFATMIGLAMLIPLIGAQIILLLLALYFISIGEIKGAVITLFVGYPLLSGWIDFYYRPVMMGKRVAIHPVMMMIGIFAGVPFMGLAGFILGPVLIALVVTGYKILAEEICDQACQTSQK